MLQRMIFTQADVMEKIAAMPGEARAAVHEQLKPDDYKSRLLKYIPAEVVAMYITLDSITRSAGNQIPLQPALWIVFTLLLIGTPLWLWRVMKVTKRGQLVISFFAFAVWVFALGGPFALQQWYHPVYGALLMPLYTFLVPIIKGGT